MTLTSRIAKDMYLLITRTIFDPISTKKKLDFYLERKRITYDEYEYLLATMEDVLAKQTEEELAKIK